jgi:hypothetical protein
VHIRDRGKGPQTASARGASIRLIITRTAVWKTQKESKQTVPHHVESPFGGATVADRKEMEVHRMSDSLSEKARRDLVQAKMAALAKSLIDTERAYFIKTLWQLDLTQEERADLMKLLREQGVMHLLPGPAEEKGESRKAFL